MEISELVDKYLAQIEIEDTDFLDVDDGDCDCAALSLQIPLALLQEYVQLKGSTVSYCGSSYYRNLGLPDETAFVKDTGLVKRLRSRCGTFRGGHEELANILDFLEGDNIYARYNNFDSSENWVGLSIQDIVPGIDD